MARRYNQYADSPEEDFGDGGGSFGIGDGATQPGDSPASVQPVEQEIPAIGAPPVGGGEGSTDSPREIFDRPETRPPDVGMRPPPGGEPSEAAPVRPKSPAPVAGQPPQPFSPMEQMDPTALVQPRDPGAANVALRAPGMPQPTTAAPSRPMSPTPIALRSQAQQYGGGQGGQALFGRAGGLLGGGLGVPGAGDDFEDNGDGLDALIQLLLQGGQR